MSRRCRPSSAEFDCRNNRLAELALRQDGFWTRCAAAAARWGPRRIGVFIGTSTAGILQTELAYRRARSGQRRAAGELRLRRDSQFILGGRLHAAALRPRGSGDGRVLVRARRAPRYSASARRMIEAGLIDAALVGGVDSLCLTTLYGFHSLQLSSPAPCRPFDVARDGISIGEAAAFALLERAPEELDSDDVLLLGVGESSDAYHMSAPHPEGHGARRAMQAALAAASLEPGDDRLHQSARHRNPEQRSLGKPGGDQYIRRRPRPAARPRAQPATRWARPARWRRSSARWPCGMD